MNKRSTRRTLISKILSRPPLFMEIDYYHNIFVQTNLTYLPDIDKSPKGVLCLGLGGKERPAVFKRNHYIS